MNADALSFVARKSSCCSWIATFPPRPWFWGAAAHRQSFCVWSEGMSAGPTWLALTCCCPGMMWRGFYPAAPQSRTNIRVKHREIKVTPLLSCTCAKLPSCKKRKMCRPLSSMRPPHKHSHGCTHTEKALREANHLWAPVYLLPGNEGGPLMYTLCIYVRTRSRLRSGDRHGAVG